MKTILFALLISFSATSSFATECVVNGKDVFKDPSIFVPAIKHSKHCFEAKALAESCAYGSSLDVQIAGAAYEVCAKELKAYPSKSEFADLLARMTKACETTYSKMDGTMYMSMNAYCNLSAIEWILNLASNEAEDLEL